MKFNRCAIRILRTLETGGRSANVLSGLADRTTPPAAQRTEFEQAIGQLFLAGVVQWNGKTTARVLTLKAKRA